MATTPVCGVDIGGTKVLATWFDAAAPDLASSSPFTSRRADTRHDVDGLLDLIVSMVRSCEGEADGPGGSPCGTVRAIGVGMAGLVDRSGHLRVGPNLPGVVDASVRERLSEVLGVPVVVENDATAAAWGEFVAGGHETTELMLVTLGTGIGSGAVQGGVLQVGATGFAGESGHMIVDPDGPLCPCGKRGCWERYASGSGLGRLGRDAAEAGRLGSVVEAVGGDPEDVHGEHVGRAALGGDPQALVVLHEFAWWVALGLANLANIADPEVFVIGGGLTTLGDVLLDPVREAFAELLYAHDRRTPVRIEGATLGEEAGAIGVGLLAAELLAE